MSDNYKGYVRFWIKYDPHAPVYETGAEGSVVAGWIHETHQVIFFFKHFIECVFWKNKMKWVFEPDTI